MGSLDDAIREHLELKRQRGASDEEVKRQEEEAFGRGRRSAPEEAPVADAPASGELAEQELEAAEPGSNGQPAEHPGAAATLEPEPLEPEPLEPEPLEPEPFEPDEVPAEESLQTEVTVRDARDAPAEDWDEAQESEAAPSSDPLEETPEFLEGSPEEDRLWFEQRPPKDFDLD
jgi:hypothetical protein